MSFLLKIINFTIFAVKLFNFSGGKPTKKKLENYLKLALSIMNWFKGLQQLTWKKFLLEYSAVFVGVLVGIPVGFKIRGTQELEQEALKSYWYMNIMGIDPSYRVLVTNMENLQNASLPPETFLAAAENVLSKIRELQPNEQTHPAAQFIKEYYDIMDKQWLSKSDRKHREQHKYDIMKTRKRRDMLLAHDLVDFKHTTSPDLRRLIRVDKMNYARQSQDVLRMQESYQSLLVPIQTWWKYQTGDDDVNASDMTNFKGNSNSNSNDNDDITIISNTSTLSDDQKWHRTSISALEKASEKRRQLQARVHADWDSSQSKMSAEEMQTLRMTKTATKTEIKTETKTEPETETETVETKQSDKEPQHNTKVINKGLTEEELMTIFDHAPYLGDWKRYEEIGDAFQQSFGDIDSLAFSKFNDNSINVNDLYVLTKQYDLGHTIVLPNDASLRFSRRTIRSIRVKYRQCNITPIDMNTNTNTNTNAIGGNDHYSSPLLQKSSSSTRDTLECKALQSSLQEFTKTHQSQWHTLLDQEVKPTTDYSIKVSQVQSTVDGEASAIDTHALRPSIHFLGGVQKCFSLTGCVNRVQGPVYPNHLYLRMRGSTVYSLPELVDDLHHSKAQL
ncbi:DENN domain-containing protein [Reticulomyxa filosa]|uniref:DENN domain-containing protein n=1 Tax=Reticulomyxa filosa TaxID=46433 RepID=X6NZN4_RETFI|nr:DENN domain-containing protein [Reticulomyxa filosa]|eukprot:ETO31304.1 DENN domain-containing protein [Reticulomyxa filosa]